MIFLIVICLTPVVLIWVWQYGYSLLYDYFITDQGIEVRLFRRWSVMRFSFEDITDIFLFRTNDLAPWKNPSSLIFVRLANRLWVDRYIVLKRERAWLKYILISPQFPADFIADIRRCVGSSGIIIHET